MVRIGARIKQRPLINGHRGIRCLSQAFVGRYAGRERVDRDVGGHALDDPRLGRQAHAGGGVRCQKNGLAVAPFDLRDGYLAAYCPQMNAYPRLCSHNTLSTTPAAKGEPIPIIAWSEAA